MTKFTTTGVYTTRILVATDNKGRRIKATSPSGRSLTVGWNYAVDYSQNHADAAAKLFCQVADCSPDVISLTGGAIHGSNADMAWAVLPR